MSVTGGGGGAADEDTGHWLSAVRRRVAVLCNLMMDLTDKDAARVLSISFERAMNRAEDGFLHTSEQEMDDHPDLVSLGSSVSSLGSQYTNDSLTHQIFCRC